MTMIYTLNELNLAVALKEGWELDPSRPVSELQIRKKIKRTDDVEEHSLFVRDINGYYYALVTRDYSPVTKWNQGGPIVARQGINVYKSMDEFVIPVMEHGYFVCCSYIYKTYLECAMNYYVAEKEQ